VTDKRDALDAKEVELGNQVSGSRDVAAPDSRSRLCDSEPLCE